MIYDTGSFQDKTTFSEKDNYRLSKEQLLTVGDLIDFKSDLLEISKLLQRGPLEATQPKAWFKSKEDRALLKVSGGELLTMRVNCTLPYTKIGGVIYYEYKDIIEQMLERLKFDKTSNFPELRNKLNGRYVWCWKLCSA